MRGRETSYITSKFDNAAETQILGFKATKKKKGIFLAKFLDFSSLIPFFGGEIA